MPRGTGTPGRRIPRPTLRIVHTVLAIGAPALEEYVQARTRHYDASFLSADPRFAHAHVTVLAPWVSEPTRADLDRIGRICATTEPFEVEWRVDRLDEFPDGVLHLRPDPDAELRTLTARVAAAFPDHPPYGGTVLDPVPHLTLDRRAPGIDAHTLAADLEALDVLPARQWVDRLDLQWWANHDCRVLHSWPLGVSEGTEADEDAA